MSHDKAFIISKQWAGIFTAIITAGIIGASTTALNAYAQMEVMRKDVEQMKSANLEPRVTVIEQQVKYTAQTVQRIETSQEKMDDKLDRLLQRNIGTNR